MVVSENDTELSSNGYSNGSESAVSHGTTLRRIP